MNLQELITAYCYRPTRDNPRPGFHHCCEYARAMQAWTAAVHVADPVLAPPAEPRTKAESDVAIELDARTIALGERLRNSSVSPDVFAALYRMQADKGLAAVRNEDV